MPELRLLGALDLFAVEGGSAQAVLAQPKRVAILVYLALATPRGFHRRDTLLALFWPDSDETHARGALNQALYQLRHALGDDFLRTRGDQEISLDWASWSCDAEQLRSAFAKDQYEQVLELYRGELLPAFHAPASPEFEQWLDGERAEMRRLARTAALELAARAEAARHYGPALERLRRALAIEPLDGDVVARLMKLLHRTGDPHGALQEYAGYARRLAADLDEEPAPALVALAEHVRGSVGGVPEADAAGVSDAGAAVTRRRRLWYVLAGAVAAVAIAAVVLLARPKSLLPAGDAGERHPVLLADFRNTTPDTTLGAVVTELLRVDLGQSAAVRLLAPAHVSEALRRMQRDSLRVLDNSTARELAIREGVKALVEGEVGALGNGYVLLARLVEPGSGEVLSSFRQTARDEDALFDAVERLSHSVRRSAGEGLRSVKASPRLEQVTTSSLAALREYTAANRSLASSGGTFPPEFFVHMEAAIAYDSTFVAAYRSLGNSYFADQAPTPRAVECLERAYRYRDRLPPYERALTEGTYYRHVTGERARASVAFTTALELAAADDPSRQIGPLEHLGSIAHRAGDFARAEQMWQQRIRAGRTPAAYAFNFLMLAQLSNGRILEAKATAAEGARLNPTWSGTLWLQLAAADYDGAEATIRESARRDWLPALLVLRGRLREAEAFDTPDQLTRSQMGAARLDLMVHGRPEAAIDRLETLTRKIQIESLPRLERPFVELVTTTALAGDAARARQWLNAHIVSFGLANLPARTSTQWDVDFLAFERGVIALAEHRVSDAVRDIRTAVDGFGACPPCLNPELAFAYDALGQTDSVIALLERYTAFPTVYVTGFTMGPWRWSWYPIVELRLADLYEQRQDYANAARHYATFVKLWERADPEFQPHVTRAREALVRLTRER